MAKSSWCNTVRKLLPGKAVSSALLLIILLNYVSLGGVNCCDLLQRLCFPSWSETLLRFAIVLLLFLADIEDEDVQASWCGPGGFEPPFKRSMLAKASTSSVLLFLNVFLQQSCPLDPMPASIG